MATAKASDGLASTSTSTKNNGGSAKKVANSSLLKNVSVSNPSVGVFGSKVYDDDYANKALNDGVFAYNNQRPVAKRTTTKLATVTKTFLQSGALVPTNIRGIHKRESYKFYHTATAIRTGTWNIYSGRFSSVPSSGTDVLHPSSGTHDKAASVSRLSPGQLVYRTGSKVPVVDAYKAKKG